MAFKTAGLLLGFLMALSAARADWKVNFAHRLGHDNWAAKKAPASSTPAVSSDSLLDEVLNSSQPTQEIVILNTDHGFVPATVRVREGRRYKIYVVNVNKDEKNVSFILGAFSEHHATYYGKIKSFAIVPKKVGVYSFQSPETSAQGQLVVYPGAPTPQLSAPAPVQVRQPASE